MLNSAGDNAKIRFIMALTNKYIKMNMGGGLDNKIIKTSIQNPAATP